jgi:LysR family transcriptional regulator for bpeEF and oprC
MDRFEAMRAFTQVVESLSFTKAARQLNLHKASVSQQIHQLEDKLGTRLLERTTRSVAPTAEGVRYYRHACEILQQVDEAEAQLRKDSAAAAGHLRVDVPVAVGRMIFVPEVRAFLDRHPRLTLELGCTDRVVDLVQEGVDCALRGGELADSRLSARRIGNLRFVLCAAPRYIDEHGLPETPDDLPRHFRVGYLAASTGRLQPVRLLGAERKIEVDMPARFVTTDSGAVLSAGLDGLGLVHVSEFVASHHLASGALVRVLPRWRCPSLPMHLLTPTSRKRAARVQAFIDWAHALLMRRLGAHLEPR